MIYKYIDIETQLQELNIKYKDLNAKYKDLTPNYIKFNEINYSSIHNIIFYDSELKFDEERKEKFDLISKEFSNKYPNKQILFLEKLGEINAGHNYSIYSFIQISNNIIIDNDALNIYFNETTRNIDYILSASEYDRNSLNSLRGQLNSYPIDYKVNWKNVPKDNIIKIDKNDIKDIAKKHIAEEYNISRELKCQMELRYYESKICWRITFIHSVDEISIYIDANSGEIIDTREKQVIWIYDD